MIGMRVQNCKRGYWGNAMSPKEQKESQCQPCNCYAPGTQKKTVDYDVLACSQEDGQCACLQHVTVSRRTVLVAAA